MNIPDYLNLRKPLALGLLLLATGVVADAEVTVTNVTAAQRPGTKLVDITYDVASTAASTVTVSLSVSNGAVPVPAASLTGHVGAGVATGTGKTIVWNAGADWSGNVAAGVGFNLTADDEAALPVPDGMVLVPGGSLPDIGNGALNVASFPIGKYEVTWGEWQTVRAWGASRGYDLASVGSGSAANHPVHGVNWYQVVKWCNAKSEMESRIPVYTVSGAVYRSGQNDDVAVNATASGYRLPTDAEWEYAARGGTLTHGYTYSGSNNLDAVGWYDGNSGGATHVVGTQAVNELGLHDMSGNVWEWCFDWHPYYGSHRIPRGGSWYNAASLSGVAFRGHNPPWESLNNLGFRVALSSIPAATGSGGTTAPTDTRDYTLTVSSDHGTPVPGIGTHATYCWRSTVTATVDAVVGGHACTGWTGTGSFPATGSANTTGQIVLNEVASSIAWQWGATAPTDLSLMPASVAENAPVDTAVGTLAGSGGSGSYGYALVAGSGSTDNAMFAITGDQLKVTGALDYEVRATAAVRVRVTDILSGNSYEKSLTLAILDDTAEDGDQDGLTDAQEDARSTSRTNPDTDGDGLNDGAEVNTHQTNPTLADTDGDKFDDGFEIRKGWNAVNGDDSDVTAYMATRLRNSVTEQQVLGLYTEDAIRNVLVDAPLIKVVGGQIILNLQLQKSDNLQNWTPFGDPLEWVDSAPGNKAFYRLLIR